MMVLHEEELKEGDYLNNEDLVSRHFYDFYCVIWTFFAAKFEEFGDFWVWIVR